jgi:hypothetical protein
MQLKKEPNVAVIHSYPHFIYAWPVIVFGFLLAALQSVGWVSEGAAAWTYIVVVCLVMLTMGVDLGRNTSIFCLVLFAAGWLGILWLQAARNVMLFARLGEAIARLQPRISPQAMSVVGVILGIIYAVMIIMAIVNDRWRITHNEIEHHSFGFKDDATGRGAKRVRASYPDILELVICLSGTIDVFSATGTQKLVTINNVPFLPLRMKKISRILEVSAVDGSGTYEEEEEHPSA